MWGRRRRLRHLESAVADGKAVQAELTRRLEFFEQIAAAAGAAPPALPGQAATALPPAVPMPPTLLAAARDVPRRDVPVRLDVGGTDVIAVIGGEGDPRAWWTTIWQLTSTPEEAP